jgi:hypothetical protein
VLAHELNREPKAPAPNKKAGLFNLANRMIRFGKLDDLVSSGPAVFRATVGSIEGVLPPI